MSARTEKEPIICLGGPTGCGKTALAIRIAREFGCEIINADSRQVYRDFPVITAQPDEAERGGLAHHLYGFLATNKKMDAGSWLKLAREKIGEIRARGALPLLVGGTGFYFQTLLHGISPIPSIPVAISEFCQREMEARGSEHMHQELSAFDPKVAAKIHPHDRQRVQRAFEVFYATGKALGWWQGQAPQEAPFSGPLFIMRVALPGLEPFLRERVEKMLAAGGLEEARLAYESCPNADAPGWSGIGCSELLAHITGKITLDECRKLWHAHTRAYAKRQLTWFRGRPEAEWINGPDEIMEKLARFLASRQAL